MSINLLVSIKNEVHKLSSKEKTQLAEYLLKETKNSKSNDLGLAAESETEIRTLQMAWIKANREKYAGQYVALVGNKLVGTGKTIREANEQAKQNGVLKPFLVRISGKDEILSGSW